MNMISTGAFLPETDASTKQNELVKKLTSAWEKKNSKTARAGGASLMALSLAACGGEDNTPFSAADVADAEAAATTAALTAADGTPYESVDAAVTAGADAATEDMINEINSALGTSLTAADDAATVISTVQTSNDVEIAAAATTAAEEAAAATAATVAEAAAAELAAANEATATAEAATATAEAATADLQTLYDALVASNATLQTAYDALTTPAEGELTTATNNLAGTAVNDSFTGTFGTGATLTASDTIIDASTTDSDTLTLTGAAFANSADTSVATITNIENVNIVFDTLTNATVDAAGVTTASTMAVSNVRDGSGAALTVSNITDGTTLNVSDFNTVTNATADADGDLTLNANTATTNVRGTVSGDGILTVNAAAATGTVRGDSATGNVTLDAAAATVLTANSTSGDISVTGAANANVDAVSTSAGDITVTTALADDVVVTTTGAGTATVTGEGDTAMNVTARTSTITLSANDTTNNAAVTITGTGAGVESDAATITSGDDFTLTNVVGTDAVETINVTGTAAIEAQMQGTTAGATTYTGDSNVTFTGDHALFHTATVSGGAALDITAMNADTDLSKATGTIELSAAAAAGTEILSVNDNATVLLSASNTLEINADDDVTNTATSYLEGTLNLTVGSDQSGTITIDASAASTDGFDTVNVSATTAVTTGLDLRTASTTAINLDGSVNVAVDATTTGASLDASNMTGVLTATQTANLLSVTGGSGNDVLTSDDTTATAVVAGGAGNDTLDLGGAFAGTATGGDGTDELDVTAAVNISSATISGFETIDVNTFDVTVDESLLNGANVVVQSTGGGNDTITLTNILATTDLSTLSLADSNVDFNIDFSGANRDATLGAGASASITGSSGTDVIVGSTGADTLLGGGGADSVTGGNGADYIDGGAGADTTLAGGNGADTILGGAGDDTGVDGGAGDDVIDGGAGADTLNGGADDDTITGGEGADTIDGDAGEDSIILTETSSAVDTVVVSAVVGTSSDSGSKTVAGNDNNVGEDTITGFAFGSDVIKIVATSAVSYVHGTDSGIGTADADAAATGIAGDYAVTVGLVDLDNDAVFNGVDDVVLNFTSPNAALTEARFEAALQYDVVLADGANQTFTSGGQADVIQSGDGNDVIDGGAGNDTFKYVDAGDSGLNNAAVAYTGIDTVTTNAGDIFDYTAADIDAVVASLVNDGGAVDTNGDDLIASLNTAFTGNDDGTANVEAVLVDFTGGEQFLAIDIDSSQTITASDIVVAISGTVTGLTLNADGNAVIA